MPCTSQAGCLSSCSVCLGSSECANSLMGIVSWCADDGQCFRLWCGPVGGLCPKCALRGLMQPHHHSSEPVNNALPVDVRGSVQSVQCTYTSGPVVVGLWGVPACDTGHPLDLTKAEVIDHHPHTMTHYLLGSWHIQRNQSTLNREKGTLPEAYKAFLE